MFYVLLFLDSTLFILGFASSKAFAWRRRHRVTRNSHCSDCHSTKSQFWKQRTGRDLKMIETGLFLIIYSFRSRFWCISPLACLVVFRLSSHLPTSPKACSLMDPAVPKGHSLYSPSGLLRNYAWRWSAMVDLEFTIVTNAKECILGAVFIRLETAYLFNCAICCFVNDSNAEHDLSSVTLNWIPDV